MSESLLNRCKSVGIRLTEKRRVVIQVLEDSSDHPNVVEVHVRSQLIDPQISIATVYRTVKLFEEVGLIEKHDFGDGLARYEDAEREHHDHLIDIDSGQVFEFCDEKLEALQIGIAKDMGFELRGHRLELYGVPLKRKKTKK